MYHGQLVDEGRRHQHALSSCPRRPRLAFRSIWEEIESRLRSGAADVDQPACSCSYRIAFEGERCSGKWDWMQSYDAGDRPPFNGHAAASGSCSACAGNAGDDQRQSDADHGS
jgi:hypothetical protein